MTTASLDLRTGSGSVRSADGTSIAWFHEGGASGTPLLLVHGTTADHTTFRRLSPRLAITHRVVSIDRRGRGGSGDTLPYTIEREFEDVAAVADALAAATGGPVDTFGHSFGGRCVLGAAMLTRSIRRVAAYEGAVDPDVALRQPGLVARLQRLLAEQRAADMLEVFLRDGVDFTGEEWEAFRSAPTWPARVAAASTVPRELRAGAGNGSAMERYASVDRPVLLIIGSQSPPYFAAGARGLIERLADGRLAVIEGARHGATHSHVEELAALLDAFLDDATSSTRH